MAADICYMYRTRDWAPWAAVVATTGVLMSVSSPFVALGTLEDMANPTVTQQAPYTWTDGDKVGGWRVVFAGYGNVKHRAGGRSLTLTPKKVEVAEETHAALVVSQRKYRAKCDKFRLNVRTVHQLREVSPNPWETGWVIWDYQDNDHFSFLIAKPNGWEIGKRDPAYPGGQRFLKTGNMRTPVNKRISVSIERKRITQKKTRTKIWIGKKKIFVTDRERPYMGGNFGLYTEDAVAVFSGVKHKKC